MSEKYPNALKVFLNKMLSFNVFKSLLSHSPHGTKNSISMPKNSKSH